MNTFQRSSHFSLKSETFANQVGGSVGLWLGLGVLQAGEILINFFFAKILPRVAQKISGGDQIKREED